MHAPPLQPRALPARARTLTLTGCAAVPYAALFRLEGGDAQIHEVQVIV